MSACENCGAPAKRRFCTQVCHAKAKRAGTTRACAYCSGVFYATRAESKRGNAIYCSIPCRRTRERNGAKSYLRRGTAHVHRLVMEEKLGRPLMPGEEVHHENRNIHDNRPENLVLHASHGEHMREHIAAGDFAFGSHAQVVAAGHASGVVRRAKGLVAPEAKARIREARARGELLRVIAEQVGISQGRVHHICCEQPRVVKGSASPC